MSSRPHLFLQYHNMGIVYHNIGKCDEPAGCDMDDLALVIINRTQCAFPGGSPDVDRTADDDHFLRGKRILAVGLQQLIYKII